MSKKSKSSLDLASVMRTLLEPVLAPVSAGRLLGEISAALAVARAGAALCGTSPKWVLELDEACAELQAKVRPALRARSQVNLLPSEALPKPLQPAGRELRKLVVKEAKTSERKLHDWRESDQGLKCRVAIRRALKQGEKSKPLYLENTQIDDCLRRGEARLNKTEQKVRQEMRWRNVKQHGRAAQHQRQTLQFICLLGHSVESEELNQVIARYRALAQSRRAVRWLKELIETAALDVAEIAAAGAYWSLVLSKQKQVEREVFVSSVPAAEIEAEQPVTRSRPEFPLQLSFGVSSSVESPAH